MDKSEHNPTGSARPDASLAKVVERARSADRMALASLLEQAQRGVDEASSFFVEQLQQEYSSVERLRQESSATLAFLIECAQDRDEMAFNFLYEHYKAAIHRYLTYMLGGNEWTGGELTQETFISAWRSLPATDSELRRNFRPWLYRIATNKGKDYFRKHSNRIVVESLEECGEEDDIESSREEEPEKIVCDNACVELARQRMTPLFRECMDKKDQGYTLQEIANELGITPKCVSGYIARGRKQFRQAYQQLISEQPR